MEDQVTKKSYFFGHLSFFELKAWNRPRFFLCTRYVPKEYFVYFRCYNQAVRDTENPSIPNTENLEISVLKIDIPWYRSLCCMPQNHPDFLVVGDMIWYFMFRTSVATIKGSGAPKTSRSSSKRIGRVSRCEYKYAVFTTCLLGVGRPHALRWFLHSLGRLGDSDIRLRREGTALSAKPRYPLHSLASSTEVTFFKQPNCDNFESDSLLVELL